MLCHIITQIISADDTMLRFTYDKCSSMDYLDLTALKSLAMHCLSSKRETFIVLDGLDEGIGEEPERVIRWCLDELLKTVSLRGCQVRLLICGQEDGRIDLLLDPYPNIRLHTVDLHLKDIEDYSEAQATSIATRFRLSLDEKTELMMRVRRASNGTFKQMEKRDLESKILTVTSRDVSVYKGSVSKPCINGLQERVQRRAGKR